MKSERSLGSIICIVIGTACSNAGDRPPLVDDSIDVNDRREDERRETKDDRGGTSSHDAGSDDHAVGQDGAANQTSAGSEGDEVTTDENGRRLGLPCDAPFPTGYCANSDQGDFIGGGDGYRAEGASVVTVSSYPDLTNINIDIEDPNSGSSWHVEFRSATEEALTPGLYERAERAPFRTEGTPGFNFSGDGRGCNTLEAEFAIEELEVVPGTGVTRFSATFEQHCEGGTPALRGVINYEATGTPDPTLTPDASYFVEGKVFRTVYSPQAHVVYGLDATNRRITEIALEDGAATKQVDTLQEGNDLCLDQERERLFVVNKGSSLITEHTTTDLSLVREIEWAGADWDPEETQFKIYCAADKVFVVDGASIPALFTIEELDEETPVVTEHPDVVGLGGVTFNQAGTELYYWYQNGWTAGLANSYVVRLGVSDLMNIDQSAEDLPSLQRDPLDAPLFVDEGREVLFVKNMVFDAKNLGKVVYTLPSEVETGDGAHENVYALDSERGLMATKNFIYELEGYRAVSPTIKRLTDKLFFDRDGALWFHSISRGTLEKQVIPL